MRRDRNGFAMFRPPFFGVAVGLLELLRHLLGLSAGLCVPHTRMHMEVEKKRFAPHFPVPYLFQALNAVPQLAMCPKYTLPCLLVVRSPGRSV